MTKDGTVISTAANSNAVESSKWDEMNFSDLMEQKNILMNRYEFIMQQENKSYAPLIIEGLLRLEALIQTKTLK